jgi:mRNA-degrading endonuclease RelE of RelBE toxin-antitoxin system
LAGLKPGEGQWRLRWQDYRLRYDVFNNEVVLHSFRHRKDAY